MELHWHSLPDGDMDQEKLDRHQEYLYEYHVT